MYDLIIIGGGAAGLAAGLYAARFKLNVALIAREFGGTGNIAHLVDNWIGEPGIGGFDLMQKFIKHVESYEVPMINAAVTAAAKTETGFAFTLDDGSQQTARMVIFANGMMHKKLNVPGEHEYAGKGVHYCYTCDGPLYRGKVLAVVGGSDSAAQGSLFLAQYASKVHTIVRRERLTAEPVSTERVYAHQNISVIPSTNVSEIVGENGKVARLKLDTGDTLDVDGIFIEIGYLPLSDLARSLGVTTDKYGFIEVNSKQETNVSGVFAAGDITNATTLKQFITSAGEGSIAAQTAYHAMQRMKPETPADR